MKVFSGIKKSIAKALLDDTDFYEIHFKGKCLVESKGKPDKKNLQELFVSNGIVDVQKLEITQMRKKT